MKINPKNLYQNFCSESMRSFGKGVSVIIVSSIGLLCLVHFFSCTSWAVGSSGFANQVVGSKAFGMGNAFVATADDPSAVFFNPGGLTQLEYPTITFGITSLFYGTDYTLSSGSAESSESQSSVVPNFFAAYPILNGKWVFAMGVFSPFGLKTEWRRW